MVGPSSLETLFLDHFPSKLSSCIYTSFSLPPFDISWELETTSLSSEGMMEAENEDAPSLIQVLKSLLLTPIYLLISRPARRVYISSVLLFLTALLLAIVAIIAYVLFYYYYVPQLSLSRPIYLQYDGQGGIEAPHSHVITSQSMINPPVVFLHTPHDVVDLGMELVSQQPYEVHLHLNMPRTPVNLDAGNFMVELTLLSDSQIGLVSGSEHGYEGKTISRSRRPALLTYTSPTLEKVQKLFQLPLLLFGWRREAETVHLILMEHVTFGKGWRNVPKYARIKVESRERLRIYEATLQFHAKLKGVRYLMHRHYIIAFLLFTSIFWTVEMAFALSFYILFLYFISPRPQIPSLEPQDKPVLSDGSTVIKTEDEDTEGLSDTSRGFPTFSRQPPLHYSSPRVKRDDDHEGTQEVQRVVEADDEGDSKGEEDEDVYLVAGDAGEGDPGRFVDSGLGTSLESGAEALRRRKSGKKG